VILSDTYKSDIFLIGNAIHITQFVVSNGLGLNPL
jgi:hypothetical protein